jgi:hypothetical protein
MNGAVRSPALISLRDFWQSAEQSFLTARLNSLFIRKNTGNFISIKIGRFTLEAAMGCSPIPVKSPI